MQQSPVIPSFGRRRGRKLRPNRNALVETLLPQLRIALPSATCHLPLATLFPNPNLPVWFEIGFGNGEHLVEQARRNPQVNFIGCEPYINGMASLLAAIDRDALTNIRLFDGDARVLLETLPDASLDRLFVLFPDPWPKNRHHKKRLISLNTLPLFYQKLKPSGRFRITTDHADYCTWILETLLAYGKFTWAAKAQADWEQPPADWVRTRYQEKAEAEGRKATFLEWVKD